MKKIILASRSPARFKLLKDIGFKVTRAFPDIDETRLCKEHVTDYAIRIALAKAKKIAKKYPDEIVIAVDTIISLGEDIFGKPETKKEAKEFLKTLSGKTHEVYSGTVIINGKKKKTYKKLIKTDVKFMELTEEMIDWYIKTEEPMNAAGAYSIQNKGSLLVEKVNGCLTSVIGISIPYVLKILNDLN